MTASTSKLIFITGGVRSGKSSYAQRIAASMPGPVFYIATCVPGDEEMEARVTEHKLRRPASWATAEEAHNPTRVITENDQPGAVFLVDCLTMLINNLIFAGDPPDEESILSRIVELALTGSTAQGCVIIVSNEVGGGIVPADPLSRLYRDILGRANQIVASRADEVYLCIAGLNLELKSRSAVSPDS